MIHPTVHLNGTSREALLEGYVEAIHALKLATQKMSNAAPNGRDYYPQGNMAITKAVEEHSSRMLRIHDVITELETIAEGL